MPTLPTPWPYTIVMLYKNCWFFGFMFFSFSYFFYFFIHKHLSQTFYNISYLCQPHTYIHRVYSTTTLTGSQNDSVLIRTHTFTDNKVGHFMVTVSSFFLLLFYGLFLSFTPSHLAKDIDSVCCFYFFIRITIHLHL